MRLMERCKRTVTLYPPKGGAVFEEDEEYRYDRTRAVQIRAVVQPMSGSVAAMLYGQAVSQHLRLLYDGSVELSTGMGACIDTAEDADYRVSEPPQRWMGLWSVVLTRNKA